jgi:hypothetical protein
MHRIAFIKLGLTLAATEAWLSGCASDDDPRANTGSGALPPAGSGPSGAAGGVGNAGGTTNGGSAAGVTGSAGEGGTSSGAGTTAGAPNNGEQCTTDANLLQTSSESHDHLPLTEPITAAALNAGSPMEFALALEQNHLHTLAFSAEDLAGLRAGMMIQKRSSTMLGHTHTYRIKCV